MQCDALGSLSKQLDLGALYRQGKIAQAASALGNANVALKCAACRSIGAPNANRHDLAECPRLAKLPEEAREQVAAWDPTHAPFCSNMCQLHSERRRSWVVGHSRAGIPGGLCMAGSAARGGARAT